MGAGYASSTKQTPCSDTRTCVRALLPEDYRMQIRAILQAAFSLSRQDAENKLLPLYRESGILQAKSLDVLDASGAANQHRSSILFPPFAILGAGARA